MTKTVSINEIQNSVQALIDLTKNGDEIVIEENGKPIAKITPIVETEQTEPKQRVFGLGKGYWMSEDFDDELPEEFWLGDDEFWLGKEK